MNPNHARGEAQSDASLDIRESLASVARHKWLAAGVALWVIALVALHSYTRVPTYTANADVLVRPILVSPLDTNQLDQISMETESKLVTSSPVASAAGKLMNSPLGVPDLLKRVSVAVPEATQILQISYSDANPAMAKAGAQAFADAYLEFKSKQAIDTLSQHVGTLSSRIGEYEREITDLNRRQALTDRGSAEWQTLAESRNALETSRLALQNELAAISTVNMDPGQVIQPAERPTSPSSPKHKLDLAVGLFLGVFAGLGAAAVTERLRDRVRTPADLDRSVQAPILGAIPRSSSLRGRSARLVTVEDPRGAASEAFRMLRTNLAAIARQQKAKTVLITSAGMGEGKSTIAANLAAALAQADRSVVLISADLRSPRVDAFFGVASEQGLYQVLAGTVPFVEAISGTEVDGLTVLPCGSEVGIDDPAELLQSDRMREVIERSGEADFVVIDGPPVLLVADSLVLAGLVDGVVFVSDTRKGRRASVVRARQQLGQVGAQILGAVLNRTDGWVNETGHGTYYYRPSSPKRRPLTARLRSVMAGVGRTRVHTEPEAPVPTPSNDPPNGSSNGGPGVRHPLSYKSRQREGSSPEVTALEPSTPVDIDGSSQESTVLEPSTRAGAETPPQAGSPDGGPAGRRSLLSRKATWR